MTGDQIRRMDAAADDEKELLQHGAYLNTAAHNRADRAERRIAELEEALRGLIKQVPRDMGFRAVDATLLTDDVDRARRVLAEGEGEP